MLHRDIVGSRLLLCCFDVDIPIKLNFSNFFPFIQAENLADFYEFCKGLDLARHFQFPTLRQVPVLYLHKMLQSCQQAVFINSIFCNKQPPPSFLATMEEYIKEAPQTGSHSKNYQVRKFMYSIIVFLISNHLFVISIPNMHISKTYLHYLCFNIPLQRTSCTRQAQNNSFMNLAMVAFKPHCAQFRNQHDNFLSSLYMYMFSYLGKTFLINPSIFPNP